MISNLLYTVRGSFAKPYQTPKFLDMPYFPSLDGWRAFAVLMVIFGHATGSSKAGSTYNVWADIFIYGNFGVRIFFLLSGFLITSLLIKEYQKWGTISIKNFFIKRALRIFPVLYLYLMVIILADRAFNIGMNPDNFYAVGFFYSNFRMFNGEWFTGHTWSLAVEEQYYLIWPTIFHFLQKHLIIFCATIILIAPFARIFWHFYPAYYNKTLGPFFQPAETIFFGSLIAIITFKGIINEKSKLWEIKGLNIISFIIILTLHYWSRNGIAGVITIPLRSIISNILISFLILDTLINPKTFLYRFLNTKLMIQIGLISYSLYVWQQLFLVPSDLYVDKVTWSIFPLNIVVVFLVAYISYYYFEVHFLNIKKKLKSNHNHHEQSH